MTRETKIGLLVGLAFIIIVGILLSEPLSHATELPQAPLTAVARDVRNGNGLPASDAPPVAGRAPVVTPDGPVRMAQEAHQAPGVADVRIGASDRGTSGHGSTLTIDGGGHETPAPAHDSATTPREARAPATPSHEGLHDGSREGSHGGDAGPVEIGGASRDARIHNADEGDLALVPSDLHGRTLDGPAGEGMARRETSDHAGGVSAAMKSYEAAAGDTLSKMAGRFLGANTKANRQAIIDANPSLKESPDKIIAGQTYNIPTPAKPAAPARVAETPAAPATPATPGGSTSAVRTPASGGAGATAAVAPRPAAEHWYVVKPGDNLTRIATEQLGNPKAMAAIKELNKEILKGGDVVYPDMKLRLPAAPIASAN